MENVRGAIQCAPSAPIGAGRFLKMNMDQIAQRIMQRHGNTTKSHRKIMAETGLGKTAAGELMTQFTYTTQPIYSLRSGEQSGTAIRNRRICSMRQFCVTQKTLAMFASPAECYDYLMEGFRAKLLPRSGNGEGRPLSPRAIELYERNKKLGQQHWIWIQSQGWDVRKSTGYDSVWGYGYYTEEGFIIVNNDDTPEFTVRNQ